MFAESPLIQEYVDERLREDRQTHILDILRAKFAEVPDEVVARVRAIQDVPQLRQLNTQAAICSSLEEFRAKLP